MRTLTLVALAATLFVPRATSAQAENRPILQNPELQETLYRNLLDWNKRSLAGAYEKVGNKNAKWDKLAREALENAARLFAHAVDPSVSEEEVHAAAGRAVDAGCDDPLILALEARTSHDPKNPAEVEKRVTAAADAMRQSTYPPLRRAIALAKAGVLKAGKTNPTPADRQEATRLLDAALALVPQTSTKDDLNVETETERYDLVMEILGGYRQTMGNYAAAFTPVDAALAKVPALKVQRLQVKGGYLIKYAWEARGIGPGATVDPDGGRKFGERLIEAYRTLTQAWSIEPKPKGARTPGLMLVIARGLGMPRAEMESWFTRAMEADPNSAYACEMKMDYLDPKWHGTPEDLAAFGKACRATKNWRAGITLVGVQAYQRLSFLVPPQQRGKYLASKEVWDDVRSAYEEYLENYPGDHARRSMYAAYCYLCGQYADSDKQFKIVGDNLTANRFIHMDMMEQFRHFAAGIAKSTRGPNRPLRPGAP